MRPDKYFAGVWTGDLPEAVLWVHQEGYTVSPKFGHLPSWTWVRTCGPVGFQLRLGISPLGSGESRLLNVCNVEGIGANGALKITGKLNRVENMVDFLYKREIEEISGKWTHASSKGASKLSLVVGTLPLAL